MLHSNEKSICISQDKILSKLTGLFHSSGEKAALFDDIMSATFNNNKSNDEEERETISKRQR